MPACESKFRTVLVEEVIWYHLKLRKELASVLTKCSSHHQGESEEVQTNIAIYSHALYTYTENTRHWK